MAAYAALVSLMNNMDQIQIHPSLSTTFDKIHLESLSETVGFLLDFVESYDGGGRSKEVEDLEAEIARAAHAAEDVIESHIVDQVLVGSTKKHLEGKIATAARAAKDLIEPHIANHTLSGSTLYGPREIIASAAHAAEDIIDANILDQILDMIIKRMQLNVPRVMCNLQKVAKDMDSIKEKVMGRFKDRQLLISSTVAPAISSRPVTAGKSTSMVGFDDHLLIIGMGGVGKTTLARNAFENLLIKQYFDVRAWATISQNYSVRETLLELISIQDKEGSKKFVDLDERELGEQLHKFLFERRYLIILDDMWGIEVWDDIRCFFPDNNNGSRIVVTTRLLNIALYFNSSYHTVNILDEDKSWSLFCQESFGEEGCPAALEKVGKKICENCKGLPLSIVVIGGFLRKSCKSREYWEGVARDTYSFMNLEEDNHCMNILSLSYNHLPVHLKPCFLYLGIFGEDDEILVSRLIKLWVAEGFLRPNGGQSMEEVVEGYLKDLVDRNLTLVNQWGSNGQKMRACKIHDLLRELCLRVAEKEKFLCVMKLVGTPQARNRERRVVTHESMSSRKFSRALGSASLVRSLICKGGGGFSFRLMRVLSVVENVPHEGFLEADLKNVNLRCLYHRFVRAYKLENLYLHIPRKISFLWNLQSVIIKGYCKQIIAPSEIWEMVQLRNLQVDHLYVPHPPQNGRVDLVLQNLQTLWRAMDFRLSEEVCKRIPNVRELRLVYRYLPGRCEAALYYCPKNLGEFHKLESLTLKFEVRNWRGIVLNMTFPSSLRRLSLSRAELSWEDLVKIGSLPNLEVLKLRFYAVIGSEWNPGEGEFRALKFLEIHLCTLTKWNADHFHFPVLETLGNSGIGEIPTLRSISLYNCGVSCAFSAVKILEEQESLGNEDLQVEIGFHIDNKKDTLRFWEMMDEDGFTSNNLHIESIYK